MLMEKNVSGFSLVEMSIVLAIIALLLGGLLPTLSAQRESQHISETRKQLDEIQQALIGYAIINGRLPCPADPTIPTGQTGAGVERAPPCTGNNSTGVLPWATLGVNETDAWGNRYSYRITDYFADAIASATFGGSCAPSPAPTLSSFALCSSGNLDVRSAASGGTSIATDVPAIIISHGKNATGAYTQQGDQLPVGGNADEQENSDGDINFVSHAQTPGFDDEVAWISPNILFNRMVAAGKLP